MLFSGFAGPVCNFFGGEYLEILTVCVVFKALPDGLPEKMELKDGKTLDGNSFVYENIECVYEFLTVFKGSMLTFYQNKSMKKAKFYTLEVHFYQKIIQTPSVIILWKSYFALFTQRMHYSGCPL